MTMVIAAFAANVSGGPTEGPRGEKKSGVETPLFALAVEVRTSVRRSVRSNSADGADGVLSRLVHLVEDVGHGLHHLAQLLIHDLQVLEGNLARTV